MAIVSWNWSAIGRNTTERCGEFLKILHTEQFSETFLISLFSLWFSDHCLSELLIKANILSIEGCANYWWSLVAVSV